MVVASLLSHAHPADRSTFLTPPAIRHMTKHWGGITVAPKDPHLIKIRWAQEQQAESSNHQGTSVALRDLALAALCVGVCGITPFEPHWCAPAVRVQRDGVDLFIG